MKLCSVRNIMVGIMLIITALCAPYAQAAPKGWESVRTERADAKSVIKDTEIEIKSARGVIIINTNHPVQIKVFTILGRLVNTETVPAGKSQLILPVHGVYIVKVGDITCKVAV